MQHRIVEDGADTNRIHRVAGLFADVFITCVLTATVVPMVMHDFEQKRGPFDECLATGLSHLSKLLGISVVVAAASMGALLLLIVPGLFVLVILSVVVPVQVIEEKSVVQSLTRSIELTKGNRWSILILLLAFYAAAALAEIVISERGVAPPSGLGTFIARALVEAVKSSFPGTWRRRLAGTVLERPDRIGPAVPQMALMSQFGWILASRAGAGLQPGTRAYARSWIRDGALISSALLRLGRPEERTPFGDLTHVKERLLSRGIKPRKKWGQNFLTRPEIAQKIVDATGVTDAVAAPEETADPDVVSAPEEPALAEASAALEDVAAPVESPSATAPSASERSSPSPDVSSTTETSSAAESAEAVSPSPTESSAAAAHGSDESPPPAAASPDEAATARPAEASGSVRPRPADQSEPAATGERVANGTARVPER